ncbi:MAG TPA: RNA polymerase sigma factor [Longimicrobiales bacterium]|nr:RNA polymerase sigma factor [Longimicrobiales bacterium]
MRGLRPRGRQRDEGGPDDATLVARVLQGHRAAYERLVRRHQAALFRHARGMGLDSDTAEDMVQEALVRAYTSLADCRDGAAFRAWAFRILRNCCLDHFKNIRRRDVPFDEASPDGAEGFGAAPSTELRQELEDALSRISPLLREAFLLKHEGGYSYDELAEIAETSPSAVKMRVHRAREELRELLSEPRLHAM